MITSHGDLVNAFCKSTLIFHENFEKGLDLNDFIGCFQLRSITKEKCKFVLSTDMFPRVMRKVKDYLQKSSDLSTSSDNATKSRYITRSDRRKVKVPFFNILFMIFTRTL